MISEKGEFRENGRLICECEVINYDFAPEGSRVWHLKLSREISLPRDRHPVFTIHFPDSGDTVEITRIENGESPSTVKVTFAAR